MGGGTPVPAGGGNGTKSLPGCIQDKASLGCDWDTLLPPAWIEVGTPLHLPLLLWERTSQGQDMLRLVSLLHFHAGGISCLC